MRILLGVGGGIAAYKAAELVRRFVDGGDEVQVLMTSAATRFVTPRTFAVLSRRPVLHDMWSEADSPGVDHVHLARWADVLLVAPATADLVAKLAHGLADDFLTTLALAFTGPLVVAPSMNSAMYAHPATTANLRTLADRGALVIEPGVGFLAEGEHGPGRLPEPETLANVVRTHIRRQGDLAGRKILVTAGPTREPIDPVRFVSNSSSGKMGYAIAAEAEKRGAKVVLVSGPVSLETPRGVERIPVETADEMRDAVFANIDGCAVAILVAAVADVAPAGTADRKIPKGQLPKALPLRPTPDILAELGRLAPPRPLLVGFAAATGDAESSGREKLERKNCDLVVANDVAAPGIGFGSDENEVVILSRDEPVRRLAKSSKSEIARGLLDVVAGRLARLG